MATLKLFVNENKKIQIEPLGEITDQLWINVADWWMVGPRLKKRTSSIEIDPAEFTLRKYWLRENWTALGNKVVIDDSVKDYIHQVEKLTNEFNRLASNSEKIKIVDLSNLKLTKELTRFQKQNIASLVAMPNGANFSVPGAGKTLTTLAVWKFLKIPRLLVICPRSAFEAWESDSKILIDTPVVNQFNDESIPTNTNILYVNFEQLENSERLRRIKNWTEQKQTMLVIDEAHRIKSGANSIRWRSCLNLASSAVRTDLLTGTPMPQSQDDLRNLFGLSWHGISPTFFSDARLSTLHRGGVFVRTTKKELELPPMNIKLIKLPMSKLQEEIYLALKRSYITQFGISLQDQNYFSKRGKAVMSLIAAATNPGLLMSSINEDAFLGLNWPPRELLGSERLLDVLENYSLHEIPIKYEWISRFVSKAADEGRKILIWSSFVGNLLALEKLLSPYNPELIYGSTSQEDRKEKLNRFRNSIKCTVLLSNPQTLGEGVSLHMECHEAIYLDRTYNAGLYLQSLDRIHRLGLPSNQITNVYILESNGTIDYRIANRLELKINKLATYLNDDGLVKVSLPDEENQNIPQGILGLEDLDLNDLYCHLKDE
jgi:SNF2 family DNA or RNA helicase